MMENLERERSATTFWPLAVLIVATLMGSIVYLGVASLFHFVIFALLMLVVFRDGFSVVCYDTPILIFLGAWFLVALVSNVWAPSKETSLRYTYYIFLILIMGYIVTALLKREILLKLICLMVVILLMLNLIAIWETITGLHLNPDYLVGSNRARVFEFVPATFFNNPNDFATYVIQILPFSFAGIYGKNKCIKIVSVANLPLSALSIFAAQARTQMIVLALTCIIFFLFALPKKNLLKLVVGIILAVVLLQHFFPEAKDLFQAGLDSMTQDELQYSASAGSLATRFALLKNALMILINTFGFGIGAGCHRTVMAEYSAHYFNTHGVTVMHNIVGEIFADYGLIIGVMFLVMIIRSFAKLIEIRREIENRQEKVLITMLASTLITFIIAGVSSSSLIQITSLWIVLCFISGILKIYCKEKNELITEALDE